jgi:hypothetical protein
MAALAQARGVDVAVVRKHGSTRQFECSVVAARQAATNKSSARRHCLDLCPTSIRNQIAPTGFC